MRAAACPDEPTAVASPALALCYVALGDLDVVHERSVSLMDIAGAAPIVLEAGGVLASESGAPLFPGWPAPALSRSVAILAGRPICSPRLYASVILL
jgi:fructose-1,6-bisphosphatase/inositol monophosphatase family enzyme